MLNELDRGLAWAEFGCRDFALLFALWLLSIWLTVSVLCVAIFISVAIDDDDDQRQMVRRVVIICFPAVRIPIHVQVQ